jgi:hypothetical protein
LTAEAGKMSFPEMMYPEMTAIVLDQEVYLYVKREASKLGTSQRSTSNG